MLEILAVPAIPLTMTAGVIFGIVPGTIVVSAASVTAAAIAFLIARYAARDKVGQHSSHAPVDQDTHRSELVGQPLAPGEWVDEGLPCSTYAQIVARP